MVFCLLKTPSPAAPALVEVMRDLGQIPDTHPKWIMLDGHWAADAEFFRTCGEVLCEFKRENMGGMSFLFE